MNQNDNNKKDLEAAIEKLSELLAATALQSKIVDELIKAAKPQTNEDEYSELASDLEAIPTNEGEGEYFESASEGEDTLSTTPPKGAKAKSESETTVKDRYGNRIHEGDQVRFLTPSKYGITEATVVKINEDNNELIVRNGPVRTWKRPSNVKKIARSQAIGGRY